MAAPTGEVARRPALPEPRRWFAVRRTVLPEIGTARRRSDFAASFPTFFPPPPKAERAGEGGGRRAVKIEFRTPPLDRATGGNRCDREPAEALDRRNHEVAEQQFFLGRLGRPQSETFRRAPVFAEHRRRFGVRRTLLPETGTARRRSDFPASLATLLPPPPEERAGEGEGGAR